MRPLHIAHLLKKNDSCLPHHNKETLKKIALLVRFVILAAFSPRASGEGIQKKLTKGFPREFTLDWIPAFARMTVENVFLLPHYEDFSDQRWRKDAMQWERLFFDKPEVLVPRSFNFAPILNQ